jgi:hypothetical protein
VDLSSFFEVLGVEGVIGTHNRNREVTKRETPSWVKVVLTLVGHVEWRFMHSACLHMRNF